MWALSRCVCLAVESRPRRRCAGVYICVARALHKTVVYRSSPPLSWGWCGPPCGWPRSRTSPRLSPPWLRIASAAGDARGSYGGTERYAVIFSSAAWCDRSAGGARCLLPVKSTTPSGCCPRDSCRPRFERRVVVSGKQRPIITRRFLLEIEHKNTFEGNKTMLLKILRFRLYSNTNKLAFKL